MSPVTGPAGVDDPALVAPAPAAREATTTLHPRYQGVWEERPGPEDWPDDEPWEVDVAKHDFTERRWLAPAHQAALDAGELDIPDRTQSEHTAVLVSVPDGFGSPVAWVDQGVAEIAYRAARLGAPTAESCENAGGKEGHYGWPPDMAMFWFNNQRELNRFTDVIDGAPTDSLLWFQSRRFARKRDRIFAVAIAPADLPKVAAHLRRKEG